MPTILEIKNLVKKFGDLTAIDDISFSIESGEIFSLLGPNGAGKTTTISIISCLLEPTAGDAMIGGFSVIRQPMEVKKVIGVVPQELALYEDLSARENLLFWGQMYGMSGTGLKKRVDEVLEQIGLKERARDRLRNYSGGMKRRVNIGVGLLHNPRLLYMDEPTVGIDPQSRRNILDSVKELNHQRMTVLYTTHYMEEAEELSDRVGIIDHGKLIAVGTQKELTRIVGEHEGLRLHLPEDHDPQELVDALRVLPEILTVSAGDSQIMLLVTEAQEALPPVISIAEKLNIKIQSIDIEEPNLEAVFLQLTGRALRD